MEQGLGYKMKLFLMTFAAAILCVNADKSHRLLAAIMASMNGGMANGVIPVRPVGGLNAPVVAVGGAGLAQQPQFAQFVPGVPAYVVPVSVPNAYAAPAGNAIPSFGVPQMQPMNALQQPLMGMAGGAMQQQLPLQTDLLRRFRRQIRKQDNTIETAVDTQIPAPTETQTPTPCNEDHHENNNIPDSF